MNKFYVENSLAALSVLRVVSSSNRGVCLGAWQKKSICGIGIVPADLSSLQSLKVCVVQDTLF